MATLGMAISEYIIRLAYAVFFMRIDLKIFGLKREELAFWLSWSD
jgi:hypothetical protein